MLEYLTGIHPATISPTSRFRTTKVGKICLHIWRCLIRVAVVTIIVCIAIIFPNFHSVMAIMGSAMCTTIAIILPLLFYLKIFEGRISRRERAIDWSLITVCSGIAIIGTVWAVLS